MATIIALLQVVQSSSFTNTGQKLQQLQDHKTQVTAQNHQLEAEIAALSSLDRVERAARDRLGMVAPINKEYISVLVQAPAGPLLPRPLLEPVLSTKAQSDSWWQAMLERLTVR